MIGVDRSNEEKLHYELPLRRLSETSTPHRPRLCLALSGGGIRAGATALGVLQGLSEHLHLHEFEYVSSVSGGGYPVFGLLYENLRANTRYQDSLDRDSQFIKNAEKKADFLTDLDIFLNAGISLFLFSPFNVLTRWIAPITSESSTRRAVTTYGTVAYGSSIRRTFSLASFLDSFSNYRVDRVNDDFLKSFPYPIFLATVTEGRSAPISPYDSNGDPVNRPKNLFEISPSWIGSPKTGFWRDYSYHFTLEEAIAASAAAIDVPPSPNDDNGRDLVQIPAALKFLGFSIGVSLPSFPGEPDGIYLSDGGGIDNQAVIPLVRRSCEVVLALDATSDEALEFSGWQGVRAGLSKYGWDLGKIVSERSERDHCAANGWNAPGHLWKAKAVNESKKHKVDLWIMKLGYVTDVEYPKEIASYKKRNWKSFEDGSPQCRSSAGGVKRRCAFPFEATRDQSFEPAEFAAYRTLGKYMVTQWIKKARAEDILRFPNRVQGS